MAAELQREDIISDEALEAPLILAKNLETAFQVMMKISKNQIGGAGDAAAGLKETEDRTKKLTDEQKELLKVTKQMAAINARNNETYQAQAKALADLKKAMKEKTALGEKDAKTLNAQNASMKELSAALQKNKQAYEQLASAQKRESTEGKELLKVIQAQDAELKHLKDSIGENQLSVGKYENATKNLKLELKRAKDEMVGIAAELGQDSAEFKEAAAKAGELKNEIGDLDASMNAMSGSQLENIGASFGLMGQKLKALDFKGATTAGQQFLKVSKGFTFKEATAGAKGFGSVMKEMGKQLLKNPYVLIAAITIAIGVAIAALVDKIPFLTKAFAAMGAAIDVVVQLGKDFLDFIGLTTFAADEKADKVIESSDREIEAIEKNADRQIKLQEALGKETLALEIQKNKDIIARAQKSQMYLNGIMIRWGELRNKEQEALYEKNKDIIKDAQNEIEVLTAQHQTDEQKKLDEDNKKKEEKRKAAAQKEIQDKIKLNIFLQKEEEARLKKIVSNAQADVDARIQASEDLEAVQRTIAEQEAKLAESADDLSASGKKLIKKKLESELTQIHQEGAQNRLDITEDFLDDEEKLAEKKLNADLKKIQKHADEQVKILDKREDDIKQKIIQGIGNREQNEKDLEAMLKEHAVQRVMIAIQEIESTLLLYAEGSDKRLELEKELYELKRQLTDAEVANVEKAEETKLEKAEKALAKIQDLYGKYAQGVGEITSALTERRLAELEKESEANKEALDAALEDEDAAMKHRLDNEQLTDDQKKAIEETSAARKETLEKAAAAREAVLAEKKRKAVRRQAILDKAMALIQTQINAAQAMVASAKMGFPAAIPFIAAAAFLGASQAAAIIAKPIPAAEKGITGHKGGPIIAGEKGHELVKMPGGRLALTDAVATVYDFPKGTDIIPHEQTVQMLASNSLGRIDNARGTPADTTVRLEKKLDKINNTIKNKREWNLVGRVTGYTDNGTRARYIEQLRNRPH
jgi:hypothetical protein